MPPTPPPAPVPAPTRLAIVLSALVYPGAGQGVQRRWLAAAVYGLLFSIAMLWFAVELVRIFMAYMATAIFDKPAPTAPTLPRFLASLAGMVVAYSASLLDTIAAHQRALRRRIRRPVY